MMSWAVCSRANSQTHHEGRHGVPGPVMGAAVGWLGSSFAGPRTPRPRGHSQGTTTDSSCDRASIPRVCRRTRTCQPALPWNCADKAGQALNGLGPDRQPCVQRQYRIRTQPLPGSRDGRRPPRPPVPTRHGHLAGRIRAAHLTLHGFYGILSHKPRTHPTNSKPFRTCRDRGVIA